uniref:Uncharacterized protein n=1 Tax=Chorda asiatica TaxID=1281577 RepID=A0A8F0JYW7_9PHAE|nr:hypothetical protein V2475_pgp082 [Chorda asiatica]QWK43078.1 hypothetical protein [Chorda asiatica]WAM62197.1 hypothetical protein [Chorda asiatica]
MDTLSNWFFSAYWLELSIFLFFIVLGFVMEKAFNFTKPRKWFMAFNGLICQRVLSVLAFYVPYLDVVNTHIPLIAETHPLLVRIFLPTFIAQSVDIVQRIPFLSFLYLLLGYGILIRYKIPEDRFVRFNIMYGILIISFQGIFHELFINFTNVFVKDPIDKSEAALMAFLAWVLIFIPCFLRALFGKYDSNTFMREAIEIHLGRDGPDFIWWDRTRKDQAPKRPKL